MSELESIAAFGTFAEAATRAKQLAIRCGPDTSVQRAGNECAVLIDCRLLPQLTDDYCDNEPEMDCIMQEYKDEYDDLVSEIHTEILDAQEDWERSGDEGWFYAD